MSSKARRARQLLGRIRAQDWWDYKLLPIVQLFVATALTLREPVGPLWPGLVALLIALLPGAAFASVVNDLTDRRSDRLAGRPNALDDGRWGAVLLALCLLMGLLVAWRMRGETAILIAYVAAWLAFVAYSVPPLRLKGRGGWGVTSVAAGEAMLPSLLAALIAFHAAGTRVDPWWLIVVATWSLAHGARSILWHQIADESGDRRACVDTFVVRHGAAAAVRLVRRVILPAEIVTLAAMLVKIGGLLPWAVLATYLAFVVAKRRFWQTVPVAVTPVPRHDLFLHGFYVGYLPIALLLVAGSRHGADALVLAPLVLLGRAPLRAAIDALRLTRLSLAAWRYAR